MVFGEEGPVQLAHGLVVVLGDHEASPVQTLDGELEVEYWIGTYTSKLADESSYLRLRTLAIPPSEDYAAIWC